MGIGGGAWPEGGPQEAVGGGPGAHLGHQLRALPGSVWPLLWQQVPPRLLVAGVLGSKAQWVGWGQVGRGRLGSPPGSGAWPWPLSVMHKAETDQVTSSGQPALIYTHAGLRPVPFQPGPFWVYRMYKTLVNEGRGGGDGWGAEGSRKARTESQGGLAFTRIKFIGFPAPGPDSGVRGGSGMHPFATYALAATCRRWPCASVGRRSWGAQAPGASRCGRGQGSGQAGIRSLGQHPSLPTLQAGT